MTDFVKPGQTVLLKPNLLQASAPGEAIVTHPYVVGAVARLVKDCGGKVIIADSAGGPFSRFRLQKLYRKTGMESVAKDTEAVLNFNTGSSPVSNPNGALIKKFELITVATHVDVIIDLPKLKTHNSMVLTGATKNIFGLVPGLTKAGYHAKLVKGDDFARMLLDLALLVKPALTVMDAVVAMEGDGPAAGQPKHIGALLASRDFLAVDAAAAYIANIKPGDIPVLRVASKYGMPGANVERVDILGKPRDSVRVYDFKLPQSSGWWFNRIPTPVRHYLGNSLIVPTEVREADCDGCRECYQMCPVDAITMKEGKASIDKNMCIRCYCCHEICPTKSIDLKPNLLSRLLTPRVRGRN